MARIAEPTEVRELLDDLSGGLNTLNAPNRMPRNQSPAMSNVWYEAGALKKRRGFTSAAIAVSGVAPTAAGGPIIFTVTGGTEYLIFPANTASTNYTFLSTSNGTTFSHIAYSTGTASTTNGSTAVTGSGTTWTNLSTSTSVLGAANPILFKADADTTWILGTIDTNTGITLASNYGATRSGVAYQIVPLAVSIYISSANMGGNCYLACGSQRIVKTDGTAYIASLNSAPYSRHLVAFKNYLFGDDATSTLRSRVRWSALLAPDTWPAANYVDVNPNDGDAITGMFEDGHSIVIFKQRTVWKLNGDTFDPTNPTYSLSRIYSPADANFTQIRTVHLHNGSYLIWGGSGLFRYDGGREIERAAEFDKAQIDWDAIAYVNPISTFSFQTASSISYKGRYWLQLQESTNSQNIGYIFDATNAIWKWTRPTSANWSLFGVPAIFKGALVGVNSYNNVPSLDTLDTSYSDGTGVAINGSWTSKVFSWPERQQFLRAYVHYKKQTAGNLTFEFTVDEGTTWNSTTVDMTTGQGGGTRLKSNIITLGQLGNTIQFRISNNVAAQDFEVYAIEFYRRPLLQ